MNVKARRVWIRSKRTKRIFLAIPISEAWKKEFILYQLHAQKMQVTGRVPTRWTKPDNFHITVRFIGNVDQDRLKKLGTWIQTFAKKFSPFSLPFDSMVVATHDDPKMIWARFSNSDSFQKLVATSTAIISEFLDKECRGQRLVNGHSVIPHVTLARLNGRATAVDKHNTMLRTLVVNKLVLYESETSPQGSIYRTIAVFPFGSPSL